jgi:hypothetical protein
LQVINETGLKLTIVPTELEHRSPAALILLKGTFRLVPDGACSPLPPDQQRDPSGDTLHMDDLGRTPSWVTDFAPFKPHTDCFVLGTAYAPPGRPTPKFQAGFSLGPLVKTVNILGPRSITPDGTLTGPAPITSLPLRWELSAGGMNDPRNPYGRGQDPDPAGIIHLPQIEHPSKPILVATDRPHPTNLAPVPAWLSERSDKLGTRDRHWALFRAPLPPLDYHPTVHNAAPYDQQAGNYPRGHEPMTLVNLHPAIPLLETTLPGLRPRVAVVHTDGAAEDVAMKLDTVILLPDEDQLVILWRACVPAADQALSDVALVLARMEDLADTPADLRTEAAARHAGNRRPDRAAELAQLEAQAIVEARTRLKDVPLPPPLRAMVETEASPERLFDALADHVQAELTRLGHWKP